MTLKVSLSDLNARSYFYQITMGCGTIHCTNRNCFSSADGPRLDPTSAALLAVKLAQSTTHFLCAGAAITIPESLQWVDQPASSDIVPLKRLLDAASQRPNVQAQVQIFTLLRGLSWNAHPSSQCRP